MHVQNVTRGLHKLVISRDTCKFIQEINIIYDQNAKRGFAPAGNLKDHMLIHTGEKQHVCPECDKRYTQVCVLKKHMLFYTGEKQHACPECDKRFTLAGTLKEHMLIHTGDQQHVCPECDKRFT